MTYITYKDFFYEVQRGNVSGTSITHKFGRNDLITNLTEEDIIQVGATINFLSAATTVRIKSGGNAADTAAGANAREVTVYGLDSNGDVASEAIATAGTSASSATTTSFWRVYRAVVTAVGTYGVANAGDIVIENSAGGTDLIQVSAGEGQSHHASFAIPSGKTGYLLSGEFQVDPATANAQADVKIYTRENLNDTSAPMSAKRLIRLFPNITGQFSYVPRSPVKFNAWSDIWVAAESTGAGNTRVSAEFEVAVE